LRLHTAYPSYAWHTTAQYDPSGTFWTALAERTGSAFSADQQGPVRAPAPRPPAPIGEIDPVEGK
jgi:hypothetical protein